MNNQSIHGKAVKTATPERNRKAHRRECAVESPDKVLAARIKARLDKEELRKRSTVGIYCLKCKDGMFGLPYCAVADHIAVLAQKQLLPLSDCYHVGDICLLDGKITPNKPYVVLDK